MISQPRADSFFKQNEIANHLDDEYEGSAGLYPDDRKIQVSLDRTLRICSYMTSNMETCSFSYKQSHDTLRTSHDWLRWER